MGSSIIYKKQFLICFLAALGLLQAGSASAATLELIPSSNSVVETNILTVDVVISGLTQPDEFIADYNIDVTYDIGILEATDVSFGTLLGGPFDSFTDAHYLPGQLLYTPGIVNLSEFSFLSDTDLKDLQGSSVYLATLSFLAIATGPGQIGIDPTFTRFVGDVASGPQVDLSAIVDVTVSPIPLPGALWLMITGLLGIGAMARKRGSAT